MKTASRQDPSPTLPVILIGAGGHAKVLLDLLGLLGRTVLFVTDRNVRSHGQKLGSVEVRGHDELIFDFDPKQVRLVNAVGSIGPPLLRRDIYQRFRARGYDFDTLIHPTAVVSESARIESGVQIMAGAVIQTTCSIGENSLINTRASVDHDCVIGPHVHIGPGVTISGDVRVDQTVHIGTGATVIQGIQIGREAMIAAGAAVVSDVSAGQRVAGVPARQFVSRTAGKPELTIMLSAAGRRVALMHLLRQSASELGFKPRLLATDLTRRSAAMHLADVSRTVRRYTDPGCIDEMLNLCRELNVKLIVPTIDPELTFYAEHRDCFTAIGTHVMVSSAPTINICNDKRATHAWYCTEKFPTMPQVDAHLLLAGQAGWSFPLFIKPRGGSASVGARVVRDLEELRRSIGDDEYVAQHVAPGVEYTIDVYVDRSGKCRCAVPRLRIETRGGEVSKAMTLRCEPVEQLARQVAERLPGGHGVLNIQVFYDQPTGQINVIEINPRFGGGYPLTHEAGAPMTRWILEEMLGLPLTARNDLWTDQLVMLRFDEAVFLPAHEVD
jgi:sugar O-acyltransferase (sialic acid O-acetyltransferase NeuD family)